MEGDGKGGKKTENQNSCPQMLSELLDPKKLAYLFLTLDQTWACCVLKKSFLTPSGKVFMSLLALTS